MNLLLRTKFALLSGALALGGLAAAAPAAHAAGNPSTFPIFPLQQVHLVPTSGSCPTLTVSGSRFTQNSYVEVDLYRDGVAVPWTPSNPGIKYGWADGSGNLNPPVTFTNNDSNMSSYQVITRDHDRFGLGSNIVTCAS